MKKKPLKENVAQLLEENRERYLSGNAMAEILGVSRTAVWKAVKCLESEGYIIEGVTNKGYRLRSATDVISEAGIRKYLGDGEGRWKFSIYDEVGSTNDVIKEMANAGAEEGEVAIAFRQTAGKGRLGRSFFSPKDSGLYFSMLLKPTVLFDEAVLITTAAAVAVCKAIELVSGLDAQIKWVNDVLINGKKVCGIGTEAAFNAEVGALDYVVVGIGVNLYNPEGGFPADIADKAGYIFEERQDDVRNRLIAEILRSFDVFYQSLGERSFITEYRDRCKILGREIFVCKVDGKCPARAVDVDDRCRLLVRYKDGSEELLNSGEISIRFAGYDV